jgi:hypothetical protein
MALQIATDQNATLGKRVPGGGGGPLPVASL